MIGAIETFLIASCSLCTIISTNSINIYKFKSSSKDVQLRISIPDPESIFELHLFRFNQSAKNIFFLYKKWFFKWPKHLEVSVSASVFSKNVITMCY